MQTAAVLRLWTQRESAVQISDRIGIDRGMVSRHVNGHAAVSAKHLALYLEAAPADLRADILGGWLKDNVPPMLHDELLKEGGQPREKIAAFRAKFPPDLCFLLEEFGAAAMADADLMKAFRSFAKWMGIELQQGGDSTFTDIQYDPSNSQISSHR